MPHPVTLELYRKMLTVFYIEERMKAFVRQANAAFTLPRGRITRWTDRARSRQRQLRAFRAESGAGGAAVRCRSPARRAKSADVLIENRSEP